MTKEYANSNKSQSPEKKKVGRSKLPIGEKKGVIRLYLKQEKIDNIGDDVIKDMCYQLIEKYEAGNIEAN